MTGIAVERAPGRPGSATRFTPTSDASSKAPAPRETDLGRFAGVLVQLALVALVLRAFQIETPAFYDEIVPLVVGGWAAHHFLPKRFRLGFFVALSLASVFVIFDPLAGAALIGTALGLIGLCHLPIAFKWRVALVLGAGAVLAAMRGGWLASIVGDSALPAAIWPVLGSMFMFRLALYMYELKHAKEPIGLARGLAYFFMLPNVVFPFFPTVDFAAFRRNYYDTPDRYAIYQRGVSWIVRGIVHLVLYRAVYQHLSLPPSDVSTPLDLARYVLANFGLYLRVSGQFHLIIGIVQLFGWRLPETHHLYYLSPSFTEFWRRINIYWKDFMTKLVFNPSFFWLRERESLRKPLGGQLPLVLATMIVFGATWALHSYQWFWLLGTALISKNDILFWGVLGALMIGGVLLESRRGRQRVVAGAKRTVKDDVTLALKTVGTFAFLCLLWSFWTAEGIGDWVELVVGVRWTAAGTLAMLGAVAAFATLMGGAAIYYARTAQAAGIGGAKVPFWRSAATSGATLAVLAILGSPALTARFDLPGETALREIRTDELNVRDAQFLQRGYYENLVSANRFNTQLFSKYQNRPATWEKIWDTPAGYRATDGTRFALHRSASTLYHGKQFTTNRWAMRDKDYEQLPPPNTVRYAVVGSSYPMGDGVADGEPFEALLETRLNAERKAGGPAVEILNFAVSGQKIAHWMRQLDSRYFTFKPSVIFYIAHETDVFGTDEVPGLLDQGAPRPFGFVGELAAKAGVDSATPDNIAMRRMRPYLEELTGNAYRAIVAESRAAGIRPVWIHIPMPEERRDRDRVPMLKRLATEAGFEVLDLDDVYDAHDLRALQVAVWDQHPNAEGHRVIAERLYAELAKRPALLAPLPPVAP